MLDIDEAERLGPAVMGGGRLPSGPRQRHVVLYLPDLSAGGAERAALNLLEALPGPDLKVTLLLNRREGPLLPTLPADAAVVSLDAYRTLAALPRLTRFLRRVRPEVLISYLEFNNIVAIWANRLAGRPTSIIASHHVTMSSFDRATSLKRRLVPLLYRMTLPGADHVVTVSRGVATGMPPALARHNMLSVIENPIVGMRYRDLAAAPVPHPWFDAGEPPVILGVGRLMPQKNFALLVEAFARLAETRPARLVLLGEGPLRGQLLEQIDRLGLAQRAVILPVDPNPWPYMKGAGVVVMSSLYEGFGNVLVEAMAVGTPVVSVDCPDGPAEILGQGKWGRLVPSGDAARLAAAVVEALDQPGDSGARQARAMEFSAQTIAGRYRRLINGLQRPCAPHVTT
ncbi:MAG TPA: glycosyltransferase [Candidatus Polarisedimenticolia bacterium]|jgi:glycosyltransferase involved in cell wall biosynthesis|nr:glycosyltransferase [Candidatus Polarisedimenticolia bacterium]